MQAPAGGALYLNNVCQQLSVSDTFLDNSARQGGAVAILNPALTSGRYILSVSITAAGPTSMFRLPCGVNSALANATFADNRAVVSGGAVYAVSTPAVGSSLAEYHSLILLGKQIAWQGLCVLVPACNADCLSEAVRLDPQHCSQGALCSIQSCFGSKAVCCTCIKSHTIL